MIDVEISRSGHSVLRKDGRLLASSIDPIREANTWVDSILIDGAGDAPRILVFGLGSGYHIVELLKRCSGRTVFVLESDAEIAGQARGLNPEVSQAIICTESNPNKLFDLPSVRIFLKGHFRIAKHGPSCITDPSFYDRAASILLARDRAGFFLQLRDRPELFQALQSNDLETLGSHLRSTASSSTASKSTTMKSDAISIKTVLSLLQPVSGKGETVGREALLWRALGELIK